MGLYDSNNCFKTNKEDLENIISNFYAKLFFTQNPSQRDIQNITGLLPVKIDQDLNDFINTPFSKEEVRRALFDLRLRPLDPMASLLSSSRMLGTLLGMRFLQRCWGSLIMGTPFSIGTLIRLSLSLKTRRLST